MTEVTATETAIPRSHAPSQGVRRLRVVDQLPDCAVVINRPIYALTDIARGKRLLDVGCGFGDNRPLVEGVGGTWIGMEPFEGSNEAVVVGRAEEMPFPDASFDIVLMHAVLEHVEDVDLAFAEVARVLRPDGAFIGYAAFMETFHEISYSHLSYMALQYYARKHGLVLETVGGGRVFGIDYHLGVLLYPLPFKLLGKLIAASIRGILRLKSWAAYAALRLRRKLPRAEASTMADMYFRLECLRQSAGFDFIIRKPAIAPSTSA